MHIYNGSEYVTIPEHLKGVDLHGGLRGVIYMINYCHDGTNAKFNIIDVLCFTDLYKACDYYCDLPNAVNQIAVGATKEDLEKELNELHERFDSQEWVNYMYNCYQQTVW